MDQSLNRMEDLENQIKDHISLLLGNILVTMNKIAQILEGFDVRADLMNGWLAELRRLQGFAMQGTVL